MDSWVTLDSWVIPYSIIVLDIQNMMKEMSFYNTVGSSKSFITLRMLRIALHELDFFFHFSLENSILSCVTVGLQHICST